MLIGYIEKHEGPNERKRSFNLPHDGFDVFLGLETKGEMVLNMFLVKFDLFC